MKHKHVEASREVRLWLGQIVIPALTVAATVLTIPEVRSKAASKVSDIKKSIKRKFKKS